MIVLRHVCNIVWNDIICWTLNMYLLYSTLEVNSSLRIFLEGFLEVHEPKWLNIVMSSCQCLLPVLITTQAPLALKANGSSETINCQRHRTPSATSARQFPCPAPISQDHTQDLLHQHFLLRSDAALSGEKGFSLPEDKIWLQHFLSPAPSQALGRGRPGMPFLQRRMRRWERLSNLLWHLILKMGSFNCCMPANQHTVFQSFHPLVLEMPRKLWIDFRGLL